MIWYIAKIFSLGDSSNLDSTANFRVVYFLVFSGSYGKVKNGVLANTLFMTLKNDFWLSFLEFYLNLGRKFISSKFFFTFLHVIFEIVILEIVFSFKIITTLWVEFLRSFRVEVTLNLEHKFYKNLNVKLVPAHYSNEIFRGIGKVCEDLLGR